MTSVTKEISLHSEIDKHLRYADRSMTKIIGNGGKAYMTISDEPPEQVRTDNDNRQFHAIMGDIWKQAVVEFGANKLAMRQYGFEECKTLLLSWFIFDMKEMGETIPAYAEERTVVCPKTARIYIVRASTTSYSAKFCKLLVEWLWATGSESGVRFTEPAHKEYEKYREAA